MTPAEKQLRRWLREQREAFELRPGMLYRGPADFVICHGEWMSPFACMPLIPSQCYQNAIIAAEYRGWTYVEGYAMAPDPALLAGSNAIYQGPPFVQHAWALDKRGRMVELTWPVPGAAYRGVAFHHGRADHATWDGDASVLDDFNRNHPLLREAWVGEDWGRQWPPTAGMRMMIQTFGAARKESCAI